MNREELLRVIGEAQDGYILDAINTRGGVHRKVRKLSPKRAALIAAAIATALLLVGCGIVYVLRLQNLKLGEQEFTYEAWAEDLSESWEETYTSQILSLGGLKGTPGYQAALEWFAFTQAYDPDGAIQASVWGNEPEFPAEYHFYFPYSQAMVDKIDEIAGKYGLKLMGAPVDVLSDKSLFAYLGTSGVLLPEAPATTDRVNTTYYENGYLETVFNLSLDDGPGRWPHSTLIQYIYSKKDCFNTRFGEISNTASWQERTYATASGDQVLILSSPDTGIVWVFCDQPDAVVSIRMFKDAPDGTYMTDEQLNQFLDCLNFSLDPKPGDPALLKGLPTSHSSKDRVQTQNGCTVELKSAITDGYTAYITLGLTLPEDVDIRQLTWLNFETMELTPDAPIPDELGSSRNRNLRDDGDGMGNTADFIISWDIRTEESVPFGEDTHWTLYLEDLQDKRWSEKYEIVWDGGGVWKFDIFFDEASDYRELEFIDQPVTVSLPIGWTPDGEDVYGDVPILSLKLRSLGGEVTFPREHMGADMSDTAGGRFPQVILKDGTAIALDHRLHLPDTMDPVTPIPLDQVDHLLLIDGTKLYPKR